ncbi:hypothetical protein [Sphingomonas prati]|nr:hypothetical protein [Sphingomonas prati]MBB5729650.1 putative DNA binding CopG/RHH family protein [Sphingomonas prati]
MKNRALAGVRDGLLTPDLINRFAVELQRELEVAHNSSNIDRSRMKASLAEAQARMTKLVRRIEDDNDMPRLLVQRLKALEQNKDTLAAALTMTPESITFRLPANYESLYRLAITDPNHHLASAGDVAGREAIRVPVRKVVVHAGDARGGKRRPMQLHGDLYTMLEFAASTQSKTDKRKLPQAGRPEGVVRSLVAGTGFEPVTFRL